MGTPTSIDIAATADYAWQEVARRSCDADREAIKPLRDWLAGQTNAHAALLQSGRTVGAADERSARELEALLLGRVAQKELSHITAAQHLYLLHRVGRRLKTRACRLHLRGYLPSSGHRPAPFQPAQAMPSQELKLGAMRCTAPLPS